MAKYRKIDTRLWADRRFLELSAPQPCGRYLWLYLLTGPHVTSLPGLFMAGEASLAESLGWSIETFRETFRQGFSEPGRNGMVEADWKARVVWIPNAIKYNEPDNPNVVRSWGMHIGDITECALRDKALASLRTYCQERGEGFAKAFAETFRQTLPGGFGESGTGTGTGTESDATASRRRSTPEDVDRVIDRKPDEPPKASRPLPEPASEASRSADGARTRRPPSGPHADLVAVYTDGWEARYGDRCPFLGARDGAHVKRILSQCMDDFDKAAAAVRAYLADDDAFVTKDRHGLGLLVSQIRKYIVPARRSAKASALFARVDQ